MTNTRERRADLIIIGAGTAGLSAAIYAQRAGKSALVFEKGAYGGQIINTPDIENYPGIAHISGFDFAMNLYQQAVDLGAEIISEEILRIDPAGEEKRVETAGGLYRAPALILAVGARNRTLGVEHEDELVGKGISYCATCDGMFYKGKDVAVVGGGNTAVDEAIFLSNYCRQVYLINRRKQLRADAATVRKMEGRDNITFIPDTQVTRLETADGRLSQVQLSNSQTGKSQELSVSALFVAVGQIPNTEICKGFARLDEKGYIQTDGELSVGIEGVYAAGDCRVKKVRQLTTAASDGARAALAACQEA